MCPELVSLDLSPFRLDSSPPLGRQIISGQSPAEKTSDLLVRIRLTEPSCKGLICSSTLAIQRYKISLTSASTVKVQINASLIEKSDLLKDYCISLFWKSVSCCCCLAALFLAFRLCSLNCRDASPHLLVWP